MLIRFDARLRLVNALLSTISGTSMIASPASIPLPLMSSSVLLTAFAAEGLEGGVLLEDACESLRLINADLVVEEVH
jgi:hypothetical protein